MRTAQDLLAERRALVLEHTKERDAMARALLTYEIGVIDAQLAERGATRGLDKAERRVSAFDFSDEEPTPTISRETMAEIIAAGKQAQ